MKKNIWKRLLSLAMALVLVAGMLPMTALKAYAAPSEAETIPTSNTGKHAYSENLTVYYKHNNYLYKVVFSNIKDLDTVGLCFASSTSSTLLLAGNRGMYLAPTPEVTTRVDISNFPTQTGSSVNFYLRYNAVNAVNQRNPVVTVTCMGAGDPTWSWNGTSAATAVFTSTDGNATITVGANITSSTQRATSCLEKDQTIYTATATCNGQAYTTTKTVDGTAGPHSYTYTADGSVLTETCTNSCGHQAIASIVAGEALYTGSEITNAATISYDSGTWAGDKPVLSFENNVNVGTATAKMTAGDATASTTFKINPANLNYATVELNPASGTYNGEFHSKPSYKLTYNEKELKEGTDYYVDGNWTGYFTDAGSYDLLLKGNGNFTGYKTLTYTINKATPTANLFEMALPQNPVYDGTTTFPVTVTPKTTDLGEITAVKYNGSTEAPINAGTYKVTVNVEEGKNYNAIYDLELGSFTVAPTAGSIIIPANQSVVYDGAAVEQSDLIPAITTDGALTVKWYDSEGNEITAPADVGTYQIGISAAAGSNYNAVDEVKQTFTITKADPICTAPAARAGLVYNGKEQYLITPAESMDGTVYYSLDGDNYTESLPKGTNAQGYTVYYKVVGDANHNDMEPKTVTATIAPFNIGTASCKAGVRGEPFTYNGQEHTPTPQIDVWVNDYPVPGNPYAPGADVRLTKDTDYTVAYSNNVNAGQAVVTFTGKGNYTGTITKNFTIDPKELDGSAVSIPVVSLPYTGEAQTVAIVVPEGVTYELVEGTMTATNAGMYGFTIQFTGNHTGISTQGWQITAVAPNATAPTANTLTYNGEDQALIAAGATNDGTMVYSLEKEGEYKAELPKAKTAGTYHVWYKVIGDGNHTDSAPASVEVKIDKADPGIGIVTAGVVNDTLETYAIVLTRENTDIPGNLTVDAEQTLAWGDNTIRYTFTPTDGTNYKTVTGTVTVIVVDTVAPVGTVSIDDNKWNDLWNTITFGLFFKETKTVKVAAEDVLSGIAKVECYDSATALSADAVKAITAWTDMGADYAQDVTAEDAKTFIYYIRITDKAGNVTYISTADATYDLTKPAISGITNGSTYYTTQKVTVTDTNLDSVTLNGDAVTGEITLAGNVDKTYTIVATDKAGNETTCTVTMKAIASISAPIDSIGESNVNSGNTDAIAEVEAVAAALDTTNATDAEKTAIKAITDKCDALQEVVADTAAEYERITDAIAAYDPDEVTSADKAALDKLAEDLEALAESGNLTDSEKTALETPTENLDAMIETVNEVTEESDRIADAVGDYDQETVKSSDKEEIEQLAEDIDALLDTDNLTDEERTALEGEKTKCENLLAKIEGTDALVDKLTEDVGSYDEDTVKSTDKAALEQLVEDIEAVIEGNTNNITEEEKTELEALVDTVEDLLTKIEEVAQAPVTEDTEKVEDTTSENVTPEDKEDLTNAKADLEDALTENAGNYTEDEKKAIQDEIDRIDDALEAIENVEAAEETVSKLPAVDKVKPDDEDAIKAITDAKAEYDALTDHEKSLVDEDTKKKLDDLCAALVAYNIIKGENGKYTQGGSKGLPFTANGAYSKFTGILVDNKVVDSKHYTAESGSTVITLKASYLDTLATGKHTLTVVYTDGETSCEFNIAAKSATPATGDNFNVLLWTSVMIVSLAAIAVLLIEQKKRRYVK